VQHPCRNSMCPFNRHLQSPLKTHFFSPTSSRPTTSPTLLLLALSAHSDSLSHPRHIIIIISFLCLRKNYGFICEYLPIVAGMFQKSLPLTKPGRLVSIKQESTIRFELHMHPRKEAKNVRHSTTSPIQEDAAHSPTSTTLSVLKVFALISSRVFIRSEAEN
jgi:hypothetical protein